VQHVGEQNGERQARLTWKLLLDKEMLSHEPKGGKSKTNMRRPTDFPERSQEYIFKRELMI
jgi:hypothetical protein